MTEAPSPESPPALLVRGVRVRFGGITALDVDEMTIPQGMIVGVVGANGAGKTTLLDVISGFAQPETGSVLLDGQIELVGRRPERRAKLGIGRSFQAATLFEGLTVSETVAVACHSRLPTTTLIGSTLGGPWARRKERRIRGEADEIIERMGLELYYDKTIAELSTGTRRIVDLACAVAQRHRVLLLDEPASGVAQSESAALARLVRRVRDELECTLMVIEHDIPLLRGLSDMMYALETGRVIAHGAPDAVLADPQVIAAYLGTSDIAVARSGAIPMQSSSTPDADQ